MKALFGIILLSSFTWAMPPVPRIILSSDTEESPKEETVADPAKLAERIAKNSVAAGDKLAAENAGSDTRLKQAQVKDDLDALIKLLENLPPCPKPMSGGPPPPMRPPLEGPSKAEPPMGGDSSQKPPPKGNDSQGKQPPPVGNGTINQQPPPMGNGELPSSNEGSQSAGGKPIPKTAGTSGEKSMNSETASGSSGGNAKAGGNEPGKAGSMIKPSLPLEESIARDFWGHLPEAPRQRMMQYFREQYMTKYKDLLGDYYQSLAEKEKKLAK